MLSLLTLKTPFARDAGRLKFNLACPKNGQLLYFYAYSKHALD
jgi:hypothetical protein